MGLDMYLYRVKKEGDEKSFQRFTRRHHRSTIDVAYWRKANQIHQWFVKNVQDNKDNCGEYQVTKEQLLKLRELCKDVIAKCKVAEEALPTASGFFFGGVEYDDWYYSDLKDTVDQLKDVHHDNDKYNYYYQSCW